jgi:hypothetical protein
MELALHHSGMSCRGVRGTLPKGDVTGIGPAGHTFGMATQQVAERAGDAEDPANTHLTRLNILPLQRA